MKKHLIITVLALTTLFFSGCSSTQEISNNQSVEKNTEIVTKTTTIPDTTIIPSSVTPITVMPTTERITIESTTTPKEFSRLIYNDDKIEVIYLGKSITTDGDWKLKLSISNNSDTDWEFVLMNVSIDDYMIDPIFRVTVPKGKKANEDIYILHSILEHNNLSEISNIEFQLHYFDTVNPIGEKENYTTDYISFEV